MQKCQWLKNIILLLKKLRSIYLIETIKAMKQNNYNKDRDFDVFRDVFQ